jgi:hypothetical protein
MTPIPTNRHIDLTESTELEAKILEANVRMAESKYIDTTDEASFADLVLRYFKAAPPERVLSMVERGHIPKEHDVFGTPVCLAAENGLFDLIKPLTALYCGYYYPATGHNALIGAIDNEHADPAHESVRILLELGAELPDGATVLAYAAGNASASMVKMLLERGLAPNQICPATSNAPLHQALLTSRLNNASTLLQAGADPNLPNRQKTTTPLHALADRRRSPGDITTIFPLMLAAGMTLTNERIDGRHPLGRCLTHSNDALALLLLQGGVVPVCALTFPMTPPAHPDEHTELAFIMVAASGMPRTVTYMIEQLGFDPAQKLANGEQLVDHVTDAQTRAILNAAITDKVIAGSLAGDERTSSDRPARKSSSLSL